MPVVLTDSTNKVWCVEQPDDGFLHVGWTGRPGPRLLDVLEFIAKRQKQFDKFVEKKREQENAFNRRLQRDQKRTLVPENRRAVGSGSE
ncbi:MAG: hypothetical protein GF334_04750 [Candidatus Altiarchaeales archaeon]|nr:hypothetical protein [Candidatus Altiarchaeales archaeon]